MPGVSCREVGPPLGTLEVVDATSLSWPARGLAWARMRWRWLLGVAAVTALVWPVLSAAPTAGVDGSWAAGLHMAAARGFGTDIVFSHGPLAFLVIPQMWEQVTYPLAFMATLIVMVALVALTADALRRWLPPWAALIAAYALLVALASFGTAERAPDYLTLVIILIAIRLVQARLRGRWAVGVPVLVGVLAGMAVLVKASTGLLAIIALALAVGAAAEGNRLRSLGAMLGSALVAAWLWWLILGGGFVDFPRWLGYSIEVGSGYAEAMGFQPRESDWHYLAVGVLVALVVWRVVAFALSNPMSRWLPVAVVVLMVVFVAIRQGLVRNDAPHAIFAIVALSLVLAALPVAGRARVGVGVALAGSVAVAAVMSTSGLTAPWNPWPVPRTTALGDQVLTAVLPGRRADRLATARADMRTGYAMPDAVRSAAGTAPTAIEGYENTAAWAYAMDWHPLPVIQAYSAYTAGLDSLNAAAMASPEGPARIVWRQGVPTVAGTRDDGESPATTLAFLCNFRFVVTEQAWWAYRRGLPRCGQPQPLGKPVRARPGEWVRVPVAPQPDSVVVARIDAQLPLRQRLLALLVAPRASAWITLRGEFGETGSRLLTGTATNPTVMRVGPEAVDELKVQATSQVEALRVDSVSDRVNVAFEWLLLTGDAAEAP